MSPSRLDELDWHDYLERRRRRSQRLVLDPSSVGLARQAAAAARELTPTFQMTTTPEDKERTE